MKNKSFLEMKQELEFQKNQLILTINTNKEMFAFGNDFKKTSYKTFENFYNEMISIFKLIDEIKNYIK